MIVLLLIFIILLVWYFRHNISIKWDIYKTQSIIDQYNLNTKKLLEDVKSVKSMGGIGREVSEISHISNELTEITRQLNELNNVIFSTIVYNPDAINISMLKIKDQLSIINKRIEILKE